MTSGTRQGGRPIVLCFGLGKLGRRPRRGAVCAAAGLSLAMLLAGGDLAAEAQKIPYGMVPYGRPVYKNGKRILWHGAWRGGSLGRYARRYAAPAAAKPVLALAPEPQPAGCEGVYGPCRPWRRQGEPDGQGFRDRHERQRRAGARDRRLHFAERSWQGPQDRHGGLRHRLARQPSVERQGRRRMDQARPLRRPPRARDPGGDRASRGQVDQRPAGKNGELRRSGQRDVDQRQNVVLPPGRDCELRPTSRCRKRSTGSRRARSTRSSCSARKNRPRSPTSARDGRFHIVPIPWSPTLEPVYAPAHVTAADRPNLVERDRSCRNGRRADGARRARCGAGIGARRGARAGRARLLRQL